MDDIPIFGRGSSSSHNSTPTKVKYYEGLFKEEDFHEKFVLPLIFMGFVLMFFFWPLVIFSVVGGLMLCLPKGEATFRPGYSGRCPICRGQVRFEVKEKKSECISCDTPMVRVNGEIHPLK